MNLVCKFRGHRDVRVKEAGLVARPGGMLPMLDGAMSYVPDAFGLHVACTRCRRVALATPQEGHQ
jgi:hypothetical protein